MEQVVKQAQDNAGMYQKRTILFVDEIHRFNKSQQDYLLPFVEDGTLILIGATTENPYFYVFNAILSRSTIFEFKPLTPEDVLKAVRRAADYVIEVPVIAECLVPVVVSIPLQLLAYYIAVYKGRNVDQPRNLAKSVTVE